MQCTYNKVLPFEVVINLLFFRLNTHRELYQTLKNSVTEGDILPMTEIDKHVSKLFLFDFEQCGIHLPERERHKVVALNDEILQLGQHFVTGASNPREVQRKFMPEKIRTL